MPDSFSSDAAQQTSPRHPHHLATLLAWILLIALVAGGFVWQSGYFTTKKVALPPPASIFLNLTVGNHPETIYLLDAPRGEFKKSQFQLFTPSASIDGSCVVGTANLPQNAGRPGGIYLYSVATATTTLFALSGPTFPRLPQISPDDSQVVFNALVASTSNPDGFAPPDAWGVYLVAAHGTPKLVAHGMFPHWSPDGSSILYVADDGLHLYDIGSNHDEIAWPVTGGKTSSHMMLTVSKDGKEFAWTDPSHQQILVASVTSWAPFAAMEALRIPVFAFWPVFSPSGNQLAFEQVDWSKNSTSSPTKARVTFYTFGTNTMQDVVDLSPFNQMALFVTDWTEAIH